MSHVRRSALRLLGVARLVCILAGTALADPVLDWNDIALQSIRIDKTALPKASRGLAMVHLAIASASQLVDLSRPTRAEHDTELARTAAVSCAAHDVLVVLFPAHEGKTAIAISSACSRRSPTGSRRLVLFASGR